MGKGICLIIFIISVFYLNCFLLADQNNAVVQKIGEGLYKIGDIQINIENETISFPAEFNMTNGLVEVVLCGKRGKLHESILKTELIPSHLQTALLLLGLECGQNLDFQGQSKIPEGDSLIIFVEWHDSLNTKIKVRIEELVYNESQRRKMKKTHWIFLGSKFVNTKFMADVEESIITTYHDPFSIIDNPLETGNDDTLYKVNSSIVPEKGTEVKIIIRSIDKRR